jgi:hypothetical protein
MKSIVTINHFSLKVRRLCGAGKGIKNRPILISEQRFIGINVSIRATTGCCFDIQLIVPRVFGCYDLEFY